MQSNVILFSQQPVRKVFDLDAVVVPYSESIAGQDDFFVVVPDICQWLQLAVEGVFRSHICCNLKIGIGSLLF